MPTPAKSTLSKKAAPKVLAPAGKASAGDWPQIATTGLLVLADGTVLEGQGFGATGTAVGEVCFNTAMTGYQEILTDPSYDQQIVTFTFPHIGNTGVNLEDLEAIDPQRRAGAIGCIVREAVTEPANFRSTEPFSQWLKGRGIIGLSGLDTRALTARIRDSGMPHGVIAHHPRGTFNLKTLKAEAARWSGLEGLDLASGASVLSRTTWDEAAWDREEGYRIIRGGAHHVVAIDYGIKRNILRRLVEAGCTVTVVPATTPAEDILALKPDGIFLSNGPGDPAATGTFAVPQIQALVRSGKPVFGICLGHQMLGLALGGKTIKMHQGHHGANHPVKDKTTGKVEIVSMNHGFALDTSSLPTGVVETHISLFDGSNCGIALEGKPVFSVQHHPEASPGPQDSLYLFTRFTEAMAKANSRAAV